MRKVVDGGDNGGDYIFYKKKNKNIVFFTCNYVVMSCTMVEDHSYITGRELASAERERVGRRQASRLQTDINRQML